MFKIQLHLEQLIIKTTKLHALPENFMPTQLSNRTDLLGYKNRHGMCVLNWLNKLNF